MWTKHSALCNKIRMRQLHRLVASARLLIDVPSSLTEIIAAAYGHFLTKSSPEKLPPVDAPVSGPKNAASFCPRDEEVQAELQQLRKLQPAAGVPVLRSKLKELHPHWRISENRVRKILRGGAIADGAEKQTISAGVRDTGHQWYAAHIFPKDLDPADFFAWVLEKASEGNASAQYDIYVAYYEGIPGVVRANQKLGDYWLEKAAMNPNAPAEALSDYGCKLKVGTQYIKQNFARAAQIFERSVLLGDSLGTFHLAHMLNEGTGVPSKHPERALQLWKLVADDNREVNTTLTPGARPLFPIVREEIPLAMYEYGRRCSDTGEKRHYLTMAAKKNLAKAQYELFTVLLQGPEDAEVSKENQRTAAKWYRAAKRQNFVEPTPVIIDKVEDMGVEVVLLAMTLRGGIESRYLHLRKERAKKLSESPLLSEFEGDED